MNRIVFIFVFAVLNLSAQSGKDTLQVGVYNSPPFGLVKHNGEVGGLMVELWEDIAEDLDVDYEYTITNMHGVISGLQEGIFDVGLGAISITPHRESLVDFSHAVNPSGTGIAVARASVRVSMWRKWKPIVIDFLGIIGFLLIMLLISAVIVYWVEKRYSGNAQSENHITSIADGLWWSVVTMSTVGYGDKVPRSKAGKILAIIWIFIGIAFFSLFTAHTTSRLAQNQVQSRINTLDDLYAVRVVAVSESSGEEFLLR